MAIDPITAEIIGNALNTVAAEMAITIHRTARSPIANETKDFATAVYDAQGRMITHPQGSPVLLGSCKWTVDAILRDFAEDLHHGDLIVNNDPFSGGSHLGDMTLAMPILYRDRLVLFPATRQHQADSGGGGTRPGGFNPRAMEVWQESLRLTPLRIGEDGRLREDLVDWLMANCRYREWFSGDIQAMIASCRVAERRIVELLDRYGEAAVLGAVDYALDYAERRFREEIARWPDGTYTAETYFDGDGAYTLDVGIRVAVTVAGDSLTIDFSGSSPQVRGFANSPLPNTWAWLCIALGSMIDESIPKNEGIFRPVRIIAPEGSVVNATEPVATGYATICPGSEVAEVVTLALAQAIPDRVGATWDKKPKFSLFGTDPRSGRPYLSLNFVAQLSGDGATRGHDGWGGLPVSKGGMTYTTVEMSETQYPHLIEEHEYVTDLAGPGQWRGGNGVRTVQRMVGHEGTAAAIVWGNRHPSRGLCGGRAAAPNRVIFRYGSPDETEIPGGRALELRLRPEERICTVRGGGGGWGDPLARDPAAVREDVLDELVSVEAARRDYGVVLDPASLAVDAAATAALRAELAGARVPAPELTAT